MATLHDPATILAEMDKTYSELQALLNSLAPAQRMAPGATGDWRVKDVLNHLARWNDVAYEELVVLSHGERTGRDFSNYLAFNDRWAQEDVARPLEEVEAHFEASHQRVAALLRGLTPDQWSRSVRRWAWIALPEHYAEHIGYLRTWLDETKPA